MLTGYMLYNCRMLDTSLSELKPPLSFIGMSPPASLHMHTAFKFVTTSSLSKLQGCSIKSVASRSTKKQGFTQYHIIIIIIIPIKLNLTN
jgi:hypothetical protein